MSTAIEVSAPQAALRDVWQERNDGYNRDGEMFRQFCEERGVQELTRETLPDFKAWLVQQDLSNSTRNRRLSAVRGRIRDVVKRADLSAAQERAINASLDEVKLLDRGPRRVSEEDIITPEEMERLRAGVTDEATLALMELLWATGLRISEALGIRLSNVKQGRKSDEHVTIRVTGKGTKERTVYVSKALYQQIRRAFGGTTWLLESPKMAGRHMSRARAYQMIAFEVALILGRRGVGPHAFRHSFATRKVKTGSNLAAVSEYLGHADVSTTVEFYVHDSLSPEEALA
jgi:site-specific recombinase XerD